MRDTLAADPSIGIVGARLLYADGSLQHAGLGLLPGPVSRWWHVLRRQPGTLADANIARDFLAVTGAALMIRRELFEELGGFDEGFVNGWEDVDLCLRAWCAGARVHYEPRAVFDHLESATLGRQHNHERNERRFIERWEHALVDAPRYPLAEVPPIALAVQPTAAQTGADDWALAHVDRWWRDHLGAAVLRMRPASRIDRTRIEFFAALARRQPTLEVAWGDACLASATSAQRAAFVAPVSAAEARRYAQARGVTAWWTPTDRSYTALREAGLGADQVRLARLGTHTSAPSARTGRAVVGISETAPEIADALARVFPAVHIVTFRADRPTTFAGVDIVCAAGPTDRWGLLLPAALGHGCAVVTTPPVDPLIASATGVSVVPREQLIDALVAEIASIDTVRAHALETFLDAKRRLDGYLATQHISELARALTGGVPSTSRVAVSAEDARRLRAARAAGVAGAR
jgi:hypothetical protein